LQWCGRDTMPILTNLIKCASEWNHIFLVFSTRIEKPVWLDDILKNIQFTQGHVKFLKLGSLEVDNIQQLLVDLVRRSPEVCRELATLIHRRTQGVCMSIIQFIKMLERRKLLMYDCSSLQWTWNLKAISAETQTCHKVVDVMLNAAFADLNQEVKSVLTLAAFLGSPFEVGLLSTVYTSQGDCSVSESLNVAQQYGLVETDCSGLYGKFLHDRIRETAYSLVSSERERCEMHLKLGKALKRISEQEATSVFQTTSMCRDWTTIFAANQFNLSGDVLHDQSIELKHSAAKYNLEAGLICKGQGSFFPARDYFEAATRLLDVEELWASDHEMAFTLRASLMEVYFVIGDFDACKHLGSEIKGRKSLSRLERASVDYLLVEVAESECNLSEAAELGVDALKNLGLSFPRRVTELHIIYVIVKIQFMLRGKSDEDILALPDVEDPIILEQMKMLTPLNKIYYLSNNSLSMVYCGLKSTIMLLRHGLSKYSSRSLAGAAGVFATALEDFDFGMRLSKLSMRVGEMKNNGVDAAAVATIYFAIDHWRNPLVDSLDRLQEGYQVGMVSADLTYAFMCAYIYSFNFFHCGLNLTETRRIFASYAKLMEEYKQNQTLACHLLNTQMADNMAGYGTGSDPTELTGAYIYHDESYLNEMISKKNMPVLVVYDSSKVILFTHYFKLDQAIKKAKTMDKPNLIRDQGSSIGYAAIVISFALNYFTLARLEGNRSAFRKGNKKLKKLKKWVSDGAVNLFPMVMLLQAERLSVSGERDAVKRAYDKAIAAAARTGFLQYKALAYQRAARYFLGDFDALGRDYLVDAIETYTAWGANGVAQYLTDEFKSLFECESSEYDSALIRSSFGQGTHYKGVGRFGQESVEQHRQLRPMWSG